MIWILVILVSVLWRLGGWDKAKWPGYRDMLIPAVLAVYFTFTAWWLFIVQGLASNIIRLGYGSYDPINDTSPSFLARVTRDRHGWIVRVLYGFITAAVIGLFPAIVTSNYKFLVLYVIINVAVEATLSLTRANVWLTELLNGAARGLIVLICR